MEIKIIENRKRIGKKKSMKTKASSLKRSIKLIKYLAKLGFPGGSEGKESVCNAGNLGSIPEAGRFPGEGNGYLLQYSWPGEFHGQRSWWATVHRVALQKKQME